MVSPSAVIPLLFGAAATRTNAKLCCPKTHRARAACTAFLKDVLSVCRCDALEASARAREVFVCEASSVRGEQPLGAETRQAPPTGRTLIRAHVERCRAHSKCCVAFAPSPRGAFRGNGLVSPLCRLLGEPSAVGAATADCLFSEYRSLCCARATINELGRQLGGAAFLPACPATPRFDTAPSLSNDRRSGVSYRHLAQSTEGVVHPTPLRGRRSPATLSVQGRLAAWSVGADLSRASSSVLVGASGLVEYQPAGRCLRTGHQERPEISMSMGKEFGWL